MTLYHITKKEYLNSILINGLNVNSNKNGFVKKKDIGLYTKKYGMQPLFLTKDLDHTINTQLTKNFLKDCVILKVNVDDSIIEEEFEYLETNWQHTFLTKEHMLKALENIPRKKTYICRTNIKPESISLLISSL